MNINLINTKEIELKYNNVEYPLVFQYIGPNRSHGDLYYSLNWYEIIENFSVVGIMCVNNSKIINNFLHLNVLEIFEKNKGIGTKTVDFLCELAKSQNYSGIIAQSYNNKAKIFYLRLGFNKKIINNCSFLIKYL